MTVQSIKPAIPVRLDIGLYEGDSWSLGVAVRFPDLTGYGYPVNDLTDCVVEGQIRSGYNQPAIAEIKTEILDVAERRVRIYLDPEDTVDDLSGMWDLQITHESGYMRTWFRGTSTMEWQSTE